MSDQDELARAVHAVVNDCLQVKEGEEVLVVANPATLGLGELSGAEQRRRPTCPIASGP